MFWSKKTRRIVLCNATSCSSVCPPEPAFGTYGLIFCMKTVGKLIKGVRVIIGLCKLINTSVPAKYAENSSQYAVLARPSVVSPDVCSSIRLSVAYAYIANSFEHNSYSFQWMILKPSRIVTHDILVCVKAGIFIHHFLTKLCPFFKYLLINILVFHIG